MLHYVAVQRLPRPTTWHTPSGHREDFPGLKSCFIHFLSFLAYEKWSAVAAVAAHVGASSGLYLDVTWNP